MSPTPLDPGRLNRYVDDNRSYFENTLAAMVEVPTVSSDPAHRTDIERGADLACQLLTDAGARAEKVATKGNPVVIGEFSPDRSRPTVTIYNHMDVQPADPTEWRTREPFKFHREDGRYGGRGTTDDKGPGLTAMMAARYAAQNGIPLNIRFVWEFEEEIGSPSFEGFLAGRGTAMPTDSVLVSDTIWIARGKPAVPYGLRGLQGALLTLETGTKDVHSGTTGGVARNPIGEMAEVISRCYDARTGRAKIPGFYDDVKKPKLAELRSFQRSGFSLKSFKAAHELKSLRRLSEKEAVQRLWSMPTFEVHGIKGGYQGPGIKTIVPARAEAKISMRLVPGMNPAKMVSLLRKFVKKINPDVVVTGEHPLEAYLGEFTGPYADAARDALKFGFGAPPAFIREGGSIGAVLSMRRHWNCPLVMMGLSLPEHGYHCPDENYDWGQASGGIKSFVKYFEKIAEIR
ncbi:MAG TPA: M20/M25/M40 family metallo-hydrolase [Verrucomicrobiae bacterium]|nr:M20/M25/M40 family metallo-hydrolase [Verrucomicrobiae bacterium]